MTAVEHKSDFELTEVSVSRASYGVLLWGSEVNNIVITLSHCIWILLKYNPLRSNDASASCIIIVEIMASHLLGARPLSKQAGLDPLPTGFKPPTLAQFFLPTPPPPPPPPYFPFYGYPRPKFTQIFCRRPAHLTPPPPILRQKPPLPVLTHVPKIVQIGWGHHVGFCVWKKSAIIFGEGCMKISSAKCRLFRLGLSVWFIDMIWRRKSYALLLCVQNCCIVF